MSSLTLGLMGCHDGRSGAKPNVKVLFLKQDVKVTAGQTIQLEAKVEGAESRHQALAWAVLTANGGKVSETGVYTAPAVAGSYRVEARSRHFSGVAQTIAVKVYAAPEARALKVGPGPEILQDGRVRILPGQSVELTPDFKGAAATLEPGVGPAASGEPRKVAPLRDTVYKLTVKNELGAVAEKTLTVLVVGPTAGGTGIQVAGASKVGENQVAWVNGRDHEDLEWTLREGGATRQLGRGFQIVFTPGSTGFELTAAPVSLAGEPIPGKDPLRFQGTAKGPGEEKEANQPPKFNLPRGLNAGGASIKVKVTEPRPGMAYEWALSNEGASFEGSGPSAKGTEVSLNVGHGHALRVQCQAREASTGKLVSSFQQVAGIFSPALKPSIVVSGRNKAKVATPLAGETYRWELKEGRFSGVPADGNPLVTEGDRVEFQVPPDKKAELTCRALNGAGISSDPCHEEIPARVKGDGSGTASDHAGAMAPLPKDVHPHPMDKEVKEVKEVKEAKEAKEAKPDSGGPDKPNEPKRPRGGAGKVGQGSGDPSVPEVKWVPLTIQVAQEADPVSGWRRATVPNKREGETFTWLVPAGAGDIEGSVLAGESLKEYKGQEANIKVSEGQSICYFTCLSQRGDHALAMFPVLPAGQRTGISLPGGDQPSLATSRIHSVEQSGQEPGREKETKAVPQPAPGLGPDGSQARNPGADRSTCTS